MIDYYEVKSQPITRLMVWQAYKKVRTNKGSSGIDNMTWEYLDNNLNTELYKLWNRMASGTYFPKAVKEVSIKKKRWRRKKIRYSHAIRPRSARSSKITFRIISREQVSP